MSDMDAWRTEASDLESLWLENFLVEYFEDPRRIRHEKIESSGWTVALVPNELGARPMARLRRAYSATFPRVWVVEDHQSSSPECHRVKEGPKDFRSAAFSGGFLGAVIVAENLDFLLMRYVSDAAAHRWVVCAERSLLEATVGTSLESLWVQYQMWAEWGEGLESVTEEMNEFAEWYAPYNGLVSEPDLEMARQVVSRPLEEASVPVELRETAADWKQYGMFRHETLKERGWMAGPIEGMNSAFNRRLWRWASKAEWIATAACATGVEEAYAVPVADRGEVGYRVPMTRDGLMAFEAHAADEDLVLLPESEAFAIYGSRLRYLLCVGGEAFVRQCLGSVGFELAFLNFDFWLDRHEGGRRLRELSNHEHATEMHRRVLDWCETRWLQYLDEV